MMNYSLTEEIADVVDVHTKELEELIADESDKDNIYALDKSQKEKKSQTEAYLLNPISGFTYDADDEDTKDTASMKIDVIRVPQDQGPLIIKKRLKGLLFKNIGKIIVDSTLSKPIKQSLIVKVFNIIEKDLDKSSLSHKRDIDDLKQVMIKDANTVLDELPITKDKINDLKYKLVEVFNKDMHDTVLQNVNEAKERLSKDLDDVIKNLRISVVEKSDLKDRLTNMISGNQQTNKENTIQNKTEDDGNSFLEANTRNFVPTQYSTPKKNAESSEFQGSSVPRREPDIAQNTTSDDGLITPEPQIPSANDEEDYTNQIKNVIKTWMEKSPLSLEYKLKKKVIRSLTDDIVDRKKFLQINSRGIPSKEEELEQLKYQLFRRMNKMVDVNLLTPIIEDTDELLENIMTVKVPMMIVPPGFLPREDSDTEKDDEKGIPISQVIDTLKAPLYEEIADILDTQNVTDEERKELETELKRTLDELTAKGGDTGKIKKGVIEKLRQLTNMTQAEAEQLTEKLDGTAKEIAKAKLRAKYKGKAPLVQERKILEGNIKENVDDWVDTLPITINNANEKKDLEDAKKAFISKLKEILPQGDPIAVTKETKKFMQQVPLDSEIKNDTDVLNRKAAELAEKLAFITPKAKERRYGMSFNGLTDFIRDWIDIINIHDNTKDDEEIKKLKKDIAYDLIHKIGEMNIDPEIFNDISLYEDVLRDELNNLLEDLTITDNNFQSMKDDLVERVKEAYYRAHDEIAGQMYKQNLRRNMSDVLPNPQNLTPDEQASMEIMKDQLADAFINLHYSGSNEDLKAKLKNTIANEINNFCKEYLKGHPDAPIDSKKLKEDLYNALKRVPLPADESMRYEVEQVRIRDEINDWVRELPLEQLNPAALLTRNKMIYVLSKKLFDIEVEMDDTVGIPIMKKEIIRFLKKMPLKPGEETNVGEFANQLINKLKATESSRRFSESSITQIDATDKIPRVSIAGVKRGDVKGTGVKGHGVKGSGVKGGVIGGGIIGSGICAGATRTAGTVCPYYPHSKAPLQKPCQKPQEPYPPCTLSPEDMAHLERIRQRSCLSPQCISSLLRGKRNAGVGPPPVDAGSQTELAPDSFASSKPQQSHQASGNRQASRSCPGVPVIESDYQERRPTVPCEPFPQSDSRGEIQPHILIKEYYWDTPEDENVEESELQQPSQQPQNYGSQRIPCERPFPCPSSKPQRCPHYTQQKPCPISQNRSSHGSLPCPRPSCTPSPRVSPFSTNQQPLNSTYRHNEGRTPKRDGLQDQCPPTTSRPFRKERVIELGSLDDLCEPRPKKRNDNFDWSYAKFPDEDNFWGTPCMRRVILDEGIEEPLLVEREKREERVRCRCKERLVPKFNTTRSRTCNQPVFQTCNEDSNNLKRCSKCCGVHCPYPSYLYFRQ